MEVDAVKIEKFLDTKYNGQDEGQDGEFPTWRHYLSDLLMTLHGEAEGFSGKRPFGNSGWDADIAIGLVVLDPKVATFDSDGEFIDMDGVLVHKLFCAVVRHVFGLK